ncbi:MAG: hypothetical protein D6710_08265 [Nitrospirae bacterium]|nr:MAG: hypothetical protein D6710_08265 [Nitrospirota bacterium]
MTDDKRNLQIAKQAMKEMEQNRAPGQTGGFAKIPKNPVMQENIKKTEAAMRRIGKNKGA